MATKLVLAMDLVNTNEKYTEGIGKVNRPAGHSSFLAVEISFWKNLGDVWINLNAIANEQNWILDVYIYRSKCPEEKKAGTFSGALFRRLIVKLKGQPVQAQLRLICP